MKRNLEYKDFSHDPNTEYLRYQLPRGYSVSIESGDVYDRAVYYNAEGKAVAAEYGLLFPQSYVEILEQNGPQIVQQIEEELVRGKIHAVK